MIDIFSIKHMAISYINLRNVNEEEIAITWIMISIFIKLKIFICKKLQCSIRVWCIRCRDNDKLAEFVGWCYRVSFLLHYFNYFILHNYIHSLFFVFVDKGKRIMGHTIIRWW